MKKVITALLLLSMLFAVAYAEQTQTIESMLPDGEKPVLHALLIYANKDYNEYPVASVLEEKTGYKVIYDMLPSSNANDKLNMVISSQEDYDFIIGGGVAQVTSFARSNALTDLTPWLAYAPKLDAAINDFERATFTIDGKLYAIGMQNPAFDGRGSVGTCVFLRQDYMDELNADMPETLDQFTDLLRSFKTLSDDTIPMTITTDTFMVPGILGAFGIPNDWNEVDGQLVNRALDPRTKEYLSYMRSLYEEGLIDTEFAANRSANVFEKFSTGKAASAVLNYWDCDSYGDAMKELQPNAKISYLPPLAGENDQRGIGFTAGGFDRICYIPKTCKNIEHVINYFELKLDEETFRSYIIGEEGVHYYVDENGDRWPINPAFVNERGNATNYRTGSPSEVYSEYWKLRVKKRAEYWDAWNTMNSQPAFTDYAVGNVTGYAPAFESTNNVSSLNAMFNTECIKIIAGSLEVDAFDDFADEWLNAGGQELTDDYNNWYATFEKP